MIAFRPTVRVDENVKSYAPLRFGSDQKICFIVRLVLNSPYRMYEALLMPSAKTARAPVRRNPAP